VSIVVEFSALHVRHVELITYKLPKIKVKVNRSGLNHNGMRIRMVQQYHRPPRKEGAAFVTGAVNEGAATAINMVTR